MKSKFYQWVWCLLLVHCGLAMIPGYLWEFLEGKSLQKLLHKGVTIDNLAKFLTDHSNWYTHYKATSFFLCQVLALMSSIAQIILMNQYLGNSSFLDLFPPIDVFNYTQPCGMAYLGPNREIVHLSGLCSMNYNFIYEKLYVTLYILFIVLTIISVFQIVLQSVLLLSSSIRAGWVKWSLDVDCPLLEIRKIVGYPHLVMFMLLHHNLMDQLQVAQVIKRLIEIRREKNSIECCNKSSFLSSNNDSFNVKRKYY